MKKGVKYVRVRGKKLSGTWERRTGRLRQTFLTLTSVLAIVRDKPSSAGFVEASRGRVLGRVSIAS